MKISRCLGASLACLTEITRAVLCGRGGREWERERVVARGDARPPPVNPVRSCAGSMLVKKNLAS